MQVGQLLLLCGRQHGEDALDTLDSREARRHFTGSAQLLEIAGGVGEEPAREPLIAQQLEFGSGLHGCSSGASTTVGGFKISGFCPRRKPPHPGSLPAGALLEPS